MAIVKPFKGIRPPKDLVEKVESRPYDVLDSEEARAELISLLGRQSTILACMRRPPKTSRSSRIRVGWYKMRRIIIISMRKR